MANPTSHVLFVCTANICRSPMAERLIRHALAVEPEPLRSLSVLSAGVSARKGDYPSENSVVALRKVGIDLADHRSQPLSQDLLDRALAVFCMTETHRAMIEIHFNPLPRHLYLMRQFMPGVEDPEIPDPYGLALKHYEACRDSMVEAVPALIDFLRSLTTVEKR